jgi:[acyl-carrier-protein] S-malonyltransferase
MKTAYMFPGQGSQYAGMREELGEGRTLCEDLFASADEVLGYSLTRLLDDGPDDELTGTENAQPALLTMGVAAARVADASGLAADVVLGHSLGEYTALVHAGVLEFAEALRLVRTRGLLMARANELAPGGMAAVIGAKLDPLKDLIKELSSLGVLEITNLNGPSQVVLSGENQVLQTAITAISEQRIGRAVQLPVSAPFHSSLMEPVAAEFAVALEGITFRPPQCRFIDNVTGDFESNPDRIRDKLVHQLTSPVQWWKSIETARTAAVELFVECGPKKVLSGLVKRIDRKANLRKFNG